MMNNIKSILSIILGCILFCGFFGYRFLRTRLPKDLTHALTDFYLLLYLIFFILSVSVFCYAIYLFYKKPISNATWLSKIHEKLYYFLTAFDAFLKNNCPPYDTRKTWCDFLLETIGKFLVKKQKITLILLLLLFFLPRFFMSIIFFCDVILLHKFFFSYKFFFILILPFLIDYLLFSIKNYIIVNLKYIDTLVIILINNGEKIISMDEYLLSMKNNDIMYYNLVIKKEIIIEDNLTLEQQKNMSKAIIYFFDFACSMLEYLEKYERKKSNVQRILSIITSFLYSFSWGYIILYGLGWFL